MLKNSFIGEVLGCDSHYDLFFNIFPLFSSPFIFSPRSIFGSTFNQYLVPCFKMSLAIRRIAERFISQIIYAIILLISPNLL